MHRLTSAFLLATHADGDEFMSIGGKRVRIFRWIHATPCVVRVEVEAIVPDSDPSEPCLEPETVRRLDELRAMAEAGKIEELAKIGDVYIRRSA